MKGITKHHKTTQIRHDMKGTTKHNNTTQTRHDMKGTTKHNKTTQTRHDMKGTTKHHKTTQIRHDMKGTTKHNKTTQIRQVMKGTTKHHKTTQIKHDKQLGILAISIWFTVDYCFANMSYNGFLYYLIFRCRLRSSTVFNRTNIIHMTTSMSRRLNMLSIMLKIRASFIATLFVQLCGRAGILLTGRFGPMNLVYPLHILLKCPCQAQKVIGHVYVCIDFASFYDFN